MDTELIRLFILAIPVATMSWTFTHEEVFREVREWLQKLSKGKGSILKQKFFYILTCEYCFSFYVSALVLVLTGFQLLYSDWRGYFFSELALVWVANLYMNLHFFLRMDIKKKGAEAKLEEKELDKSS